MFQPSSTGLVLGMSSYFAWLKFGISNGLKKELKLHTCCDFGGYKTFTTRWSDGGGQVWVEIWAPAGHLAIFVKKVIEGLEGKFPGKINLQAFWGSRLCQRWYEFLSQLQSLLARWLEENMRKTSSWGNHSATLAILTQLAWGNWLAWGILTQSLFKSQQGFHAL